jgi:hypothetical protein
LDIVSRTVVRDKYNGGKWVRSDAWAVRPSGIAAGQYRDRLIARLVTIGDNTIQECHRLLA